MPRATRFVQRALLGTFALLSTARTTLSQAIAGVSGPCADAAIVMGEPLASRGVQRPSRGGSRVGKPASDLFCTELLPTGPGGAARGVVELGRVPSPFGVAVTAEGHQRYHLTAWIAGLPEPALLGAASYVAWATTPFFDPVIKLGPVANGRTVLGEIALDKFLILISAETSLTASERVGPLVLRGRSPSMLMEGHDMMAQAPAAMTAEHVHDAGSWRMPPLYPGLTMLPGMMSLVPRTPPLALEWPSGTGAPPLAKPSQVVRLGHGGTLDLEAGLVTRRIAGRTMTMLAFNGQHPGPLIRVDQRSTIFVNFTNRTPFPTAIHWHGVRLDNRYDGVPHVTQDPVEPGGAFRYQVFFQDAGIYWYHPHHREDVQQELGLFGNLLVDSRSPGYWGPAHREEVLMLDDMLLDAQGTVPFGSATATHALMGRFGNVFLVNGEPEYSLAVGRGAVVRFYLTNASNTRTFNLGFQRVGHPGPAPRLKLVGSDVSKFERESWVESVVLAPAERYVVDVLFAQVGTYQLLNRVRAIDHRTGTFFPEVASLGTVVVGADPAVPDLVPGFGTLRENREVIGEIDPYRGHFTRAPDRELILAIAVDSLPPATEQVMVWDWLYFNPVEWAGTMPDMNWASTGREVRWILRDPRTGRENQDIDWRFVVGDVIKVRVFNDRDGFHAMQHPLHIHGQRFLVLSQNGVPNDNLVWKDTVLLPTGTTTDLLLELSNPGRWMVHCHIAEHLETGMKFVFDVEEAGR
jgi:FtsP/CotA-like multicopper oxidase with cupredoxin domain